MVFTGLVLYSTEYDEISSSESVKSCKCEVLIYQLMHLSAFYFETDLSYTIKYYRTGNPAEGASYFFDIQSENKS